VRIDFTPRPHACDGDNLPAVAAYSIW